MGLRSDGQAAKATPTVAVAPAPRAAAMTMRSSRFSGVLRAAIRIAGAVGVVWALLVGGLMIFERHLIYFPIRSLEAEPADFGLDAEELRLRTSDGVELHGWWIHGDGKRILVWFHGNAGNISHRLDNARQLVQRFGLDLLLVDYRGYGRSGGSPEEAGLYLDGLASYDAAREAGFSSEQVIPFGRSLGAAVAIDVSVTRPVGAVVLESPFLSAPALARAVYPFVPAFLVRTQFDNRAKIDRVRAPLLILHGDRDEIVPLAHGMELFERASAPKRFHLIAGAGHNDTYVAGGEAYWTAWQRFLDSVAPGALTPTLSQRERERE